MEPSLPTVDISGLANGQHDALETVAAQINTACTERGFFYLTGHGISPQLISEMFEKSQIFFQQSLEQKMTVRVGATNRGYVPYATSIQSKSSLGAAKAPDQFESFMIRREPEQGESTTSAQDPLFGPNRWPTNVNDFREVCLSYYSAMMKLCFNLLPVFSVSLGLEENFLRKFFHKPTVSLRLLHYFPDDNHTSDGFGISPHTDYGFLTILAQDANGGLEVFSKSTKSWIPATPVNNAFVVNIGDTLSRWTNRKYISTPHRVSRMASRTERYSVPFFFHPDMTAILEPLPGYSSRQGALSQAPARFGDYLMERLTATYANARQGE